jgi:uncharacterized delta-60 repeat protein
MTRSSSTLRPATLRPRPKFRPDAERLEGRQLLSAGNLDLSFGAGGSVLGPPAVAWAAQLDASGNIITAGWSGGINQDFRVVRLTPGGAPDPSFGAGTGSVTTDFAGQPDQAHGVAVLGNGQIVAAGTATNLDAVTVKGKTVYYQDKNFGLVCYNPDGSLASGFGNGGRVTTNISTYTGDGSSYYKEDDAWAMAVQDDGKIVVGGEAVTGPGVTEAVLTRYFASQTTVNGVVYPAGSLDPSFGQNGILQIPTPSGFQSDGVWNVQILRDPTNPANDKIVTMEAPSALDSSGNRHWSVSVARYNLDGTPDTTFGTIGTSGRTITTLPGQIDAWSMALQADGSAVVGGGYTPQSGAPSELALFRYTATGALDPNFGPNSNGVALFSAGGSDLAYSVAIQPGDGKILLAGYDSTSSSMSSIVARFQTNGMIDTNFGNNGNGVASNAFTNGGSYFAGVILQPDGKIVAVGTASTTRGKTTTSNSLIARFQGDTTPLTAAAGPRALASTAPTSQDTSPQLALAPLTDQDLTALATDLIGAGKKRRGLPVP